MNREQSDIFDACVKYFRHVDAYELDGANGPKTIRRMELKEDALSKMKAVSNKIDRIIKMSRQTEIFDACVKYFRHVHAYELDGANGPKTIRRMELKEDALSKLKAAGFVKDIVRPSISSRRRGK